LNAPTGKQALLPPRRQGADFEQLFDTHPEVSLDFEIAREAARQRYRRPFLILDTAIVRGKVRRFRAAMPRVRPHYALKANPDRRIVKVLAQEGCGFDIASVAELELLSEFGVEGKDVFYSNPMKPRPARSRRRRPAGCAGWWSTASTSCAACAR
jgi:ornithine decarboxylase